LTLSCSERIIIKFCKFGRSMRKDGGRVTGRLQGRVAIITGGASGIGEATVRLFAAEGARVVVADILDAEGEALAADLQNGVRFRHTDVSQEEDIQATVDYAVEHFGRLHFIFNNAGFGRPTAPLDEIPLTDYEGHMAVLLRGVFLGMKHAARVMKPQGSGNIVNTASVAGLQTGHGSILYSTAKAAVIHMTRCAAVELGECGIRVNCLCPGGVATPIFGKAFGMSQSEAAKRLGVLQERFQSLQPTHRAGQAHDIARAALWLASEESSFVNGHALVVDGGLTCGRSFSEARAFFEGLATAMGASISGPK
jgi:NAD(P)-dependent dehydrogenase (short-subunit alcohol dehydrogenase family)